MNPTFASGTNGVRIAYDVTGQGQAIMLLHGFGLARADWHKSGYVEQLRMESMVVAVDIRGNGESDKPTEKEAYRIGVLCDDLLAVADSAGLERFAIWGYSYGGNIGRYLAARSDRVERLAIVGIPFGPGASGQFRTAIEGLITRWSGVVREFKQTATAPPNLSEKEVEYLNSGGAELDVARFGAMLDWEPIEPADLPCPTLWIVGSENESAINSVREYESKLKASQVQVRVLKGLDHRAEFEQVDFILPVMMGFMGARS